MEMSTQALRRTAAALQDLVDAKSTQLIQVWTKLCLFPHHFTSFVSQALDEREWLETVNITNFIDYVLFIFNQKKKMNL